MSRPVQGQAAKQVVLLPDAGPLITLAYADALDLLFRPGWAVQLVDMVWHEVTRADTPSRQRLAAWASAAHLKPVPTRTFEHHQHQVAATAPGGTVRKAGLRELAIQEVMNGFALATPPTQGVFLFEDHKIARVSFLLPESCQKVSTRAFLIFLEGSGLIASAREIESRAIQAGRDFSWLRFPPTRGEIQ